LREAEATTSRRRGDGNRLRTRVLWLGVLLIASFVGADAYEAWQDYRAAIAQNERAQLGLGRALAEQTTRMIQEIDVVLADSANWSEALRSIGEDQQSVQAILRADLRRLPFLHSIAVMDATGKLVTTTQSAVGGDFNVADRAFFRALAQSQDERLHIGRPYLSPRDQYRTFAVSRPIRDSDGQFAGAIVARIAFEYLTSFYSSLNLPSEAAVQLVRDDGTVLARYPQQAAVLANDARALEVFAAGGGVAQGRGLSDRGGSDPLGVERARHLEAAGAVECGPDADARSLRRHPAGAVADRAGAARSAGAAAASPRT
jgi:hypothetical protein